VSLSRLPRDLVVHQSCDIELQIPSQIIYCGNVSTLRNLESHIVISFQDHLVSVGKIIFTL
jgi:hypothetical protein